MHCEKLMEKGVQTNFVVHHDPTRPFPMASQPLARENRSSTKNAVIEQGADFAVAFDGDFDRCFSLIIWGTIRGVRWDCWQKYS